MKKRRFQLTTTGSLRQGDGAIEYRHVIEGEVTTNDEITEFMIAGALLPIWLFLEHESWTVKWLDD